MNEEIDEAIEQSKNRVLFVMASSALGIAATAVIGLCYWVVTETMENHAFRTAGDRYTKTDASVDRAYWMERFSSLPPPETKASIKVLQDDQTRMREELTRLKVVLERIEKGM